MKKVILLGPPAAGKGSQAKRLSKSFSIPHISTGDLLREEISKGTTLGKKLDSIISKGDLISDELMIEMLKDRLNQDDCKTGFLLDGFPRDVQQAKSLEKISPVDVVVLIEAADSKLVERVLKREMCSQCGKIYGLEVPPIKPGVCDLDGAKLNHREDDTMDAITHRLEIYHKQTAPLIEFYGEKVKKVNGNDPLDVVFKEIVEILRK